MKIKELKEQIKDMNEKGEVYLVSSDGSGVVKATKILSYKSEYTGAKNILITAW